MPPDYSYTKVDNANNIINEQLISPSTIETVDTAMFNYIKEKVDLFAYSNDGYKRLKLIWLGSERSFQIKSDPEARDDTGTYILPIMSLNRTSIEKDKTFKGAFQAHFSEGTGAERKAVPIARKIVQDKTNNFATADAKRKSGTAYTINYNLDPNKKRKNSKVVYQTVYAPIPVYVKIMYDLKIRTNYQQQMNDLIIPFITSTGQINSFSIVYEKHRYEVFVESDYSFTNTLNDETQERFYETTIKFRVLGYLMGEGPNDKRPVYTVEENFVEVKLPRENVLLNTPNITTDKSFYKP